MRCAVCGAETRDTARFCGRCGAPMALARGPSVPDVPEAASPAVALPAADIGRAFGTSAASTAKVGILVILLTAGLMALGSYVAGPAGAVGAFVLALAFNFGLYWFSDSLVLMTTGAREVSAEQAPQLHQAVEALAARAGLPKPRVCVMKDASPNAFATGRDPAHGVVAVTTGLLSIVDRDQLEGILGHELAHIKNRDGLLGAIVAAIAGAVMLLSYLARWTAFAFLDDRKGSAVALLAIGILAPLGAVLVQMGISRAREYRADEGGACISGKPGALADALERLEQVVQQQPLDVHPAVAHLFIVSPLAGGWSAGLFRTHPTTASRAARLRAMV